VHLLCISWVIEKSKNQTASNYYGEFFFAVEASNIGVKNLSPTQIQAIGYANIPSELHLALGLCISWIFEKHFCENQTASNYYGEI